LFLSWVAARFGLAPIVGAFAAGLVLDEVHYKPAGARKERELEDLLHPVSAVLVPIFFVLMGMKVDLRFFAPGSASGQPASGGAQLNLLGFALALTLAAILGKQICSAGVLERGTNRLAIGLGMIPRGEVGLIFAGIGATLMLPNPSGISEPVIGPTTFGAIVIMVIITTLITPPALKWSLARTGGRSRRQAAGAVSGKQ
jgi:Kef-type K+ transport system membrane component KefB